MTKKNFIALADAIREHNRIAANEPGMTPFRIGQLDSLAEFCHSQNPAFDRPRWLGYIAGTNGKNGGQA